MDWTCDRISDGNTCLHANNIPRRTGGAAAARRANGDRSNARASHAVQVPSPTMIVVWKVGAAIFLQLPRTFEAALAEEVEVTRR